MTNDTVGSSFLSLVTHTDKINIEPVPVLLYRSISITEIQVYDIG
jgi:hypothetical protein